ncbi:hypothetical protein GH714_025004 [Hevea brasiliensis]|uniref:Cyclin n=1 Tax=Hevea brasiliensis TaxID=3981 RepID=A0A6A6NJ43_HEVBR|nr:hypothetical protein GH714_025004 [Hevea brasiliensis]
MGTLTLDTGNVDSDVYLSLGLKVKELGKGVLGTPQVLTLLSSLLERSVQKNETVLETKQIKDAITEFDGLRAPAPDSSAADNFLVQVLKTSLWFFRFFNNAYYAKVGGVSTAELNRLERKFLFGIDFRLHVNVNTFGRYCSELEKETAEGFQIERPIQACRIKESWSNKDDSTTCAPTIAR